MERRIDIYSTNDLQQIVKEIVETDTGKLSNQKRTTHPYWVSVLVDASLLACTRHSLQN